MARVTSLRLAFLERIFTELDLPDAADRAWLAYGFYVGHHQLTRNPHTTAPADLDAVLTVLTSQHVVSRRAGMAELERLAAGQLPDLGDPT